MIKYRLTKKGIKEVKRQENLKWLINNYYKRQVEKIKTNGEY